MKFIRDCIYAGVIMAVLAGSRELFGFELTIYMVISFAYSEYWMNQEDIKKKPKNIVQLHFEDIAFPVDYDIDMPTFQKGDYIWMDVFKQGWVDEIKYCKEGSIIVISIYIKNQKP